jgi:hypothetical protein
MSPSTKFTRSRGAVRVIFYSNSACLLAGKCAHSPSVKAISTTQTGSAIRGMICTGNFHASKTLLFSSRSDPLLLSLLRDRGLLSTEGTAADDGELPPSPAILHSLMARRVQSTLLPTELQRGYQGQGNPLPGARADGSSELNRGVQILDTDEVPG